MGCYQSSFLPQIQPTNQARPTPITSAQRKHRSRSRGGNERQLQEQSRKKERLNSKPITFPESQSKKVLVGILKKSNHHHIHMHDLDQLQLMPRPLTGIQRRLHLPNLVVDVNNMEEEEKESGIGSTIHPSICITGARRISWTSSITCPAAVDPMQQADGSKIRTAAA